jgi:hypothetical protein
MPPAEPFVQPLDGRPVTRSWQVRPGGVTQLRLSHKSDARPSEVELELGDLASSPR